MLVGLILGVALLGGIGTYLWWQRAPLTPGSLARRAPLPPMMRFRSSTALIVTAIVVAACLGTVYLVRAYWPTRSPKTAIAPSQPPVGTTPKAAFLDAFPKEYPWTLKPEHKPLPPKGIPVTPTSEPGIAQAAIPPRQPAPAPPTREEIQAMLAQMQAEQHRAMEEAITRALAMQQARMQPATATPLPVTPVAQTDVPSTTTPKDKRWFAPKPTEKTDVMAPPFAQEEKDGEGKDKEKGSKLFQPALWERPADRYKILFAEQLVHGLLMQNVNSDIPGTVRIKVTQNVEDLWGHGHVIIPMDTTFIGSQQGATAYGQSLIPITVTMARFPDGSVASWEGGQVGDAGGATGLPGKIDNHNGRVIGGAILSALVNIGVRAPFGSTQGFQPNLAQEYARDGAQTLGQSMQEILKRELATKPTITQEHSYPVTIAFSRNVSFMTGPVVIKK